MNSYIDYNYYFIKESVFVMNLLILIFCVKFFVVIIKKLIIYSDLLNN